jgi:tetratricopeptide (TPR) repeat protein
MIYDFDQLWDYDQPAATEEQFRQRLASANDDDYRLQLLTQIARAQGLQRKFEQAHQMLNSVEAQLRGDLPVARIRYLLERGRVYNSSGAKEQARPLFLQALEHAQANGQDFYAVDAAHMMAIVEPPDEQMAWNLKALELAEASSEPRARKWLGSLYNNIGWTYHDLGQYEQALSLFEKALAWREAQGQEKETRIARWCIARVMRSLNRIPEALAILRELEPVATGYTYEELGECLLLQGKKDEAQPYFARAYQVLSQDEWLVANEAPRLERLRELAKV